MIIRSVTVNNFGVFRGHHEIDFTPTDAERPIVLIGAMNGSGKTTLLEALKLGLYGRRTADLSRGSRSYDDFLTESIHRGVPVSEGASIEVVFTLLAAGLDCTYRVVRAWSAVLDQMRESLEVYVDGKLDPVLSEGWNEHVESILPVRLAPFFLFDGERLETLADPARAREFLANAIDALLGLDIVDRLGEDLRAVERRIRDSVVEAPDDQESLVKLQAQAEVSDREVMHLVQRCGELTNVLDAARRGVLQARRELEAMTGNLPARTLALQKEHASFSGRRADALAKLMELAYGDGPLILLRNTMQAALERAAPDSLDARLLAERDKKILATMERAQVSADVVARVEMMFAEDIKARKASTAGQTSLVQHSVLSDALQRARLAEHIADTSLQALASGEAAVARVEDLTRALPTVQSLEPLVSAVHERERAVATLEAEYRIATETLERARRGRESAESRMQDIHIKALDRAKQQRYTSKLISRAGELRKTLEAFRGRVAARHAARLGETVLEAFQCLHRKVETIERIVVDSRTFDMTLFDNGRSVDPTRLSAGERQLLAVAMVWAILKAADRPLPLWIDTPLGRLDSVHRRHLVERFFPFAAPQVVLLSTDTEIDPEAYAILEPYVSHAYRIEFDPDSRASTCVRGYFLEQAA